MTSAWAPLHELASIAIERANDSARNSDVPADADLQSTTSDTKTRPDNFCTRPRTKL